MIFICGHSIFLCLCIALNSAERSHWWVHAPEGQFPFLFYLISSPSHWVQTLILVSIIGTAFKLRYTQQENFLICLKMRLDILVLKIKQPCAGVSVVFAPIYLIFYVCGYHGIRSITQNQINWFQPVLKPFKQMNNSTNENYVFIVIHVKLIKMCVKLTS